MSVSIHVRTLWRTEIWRSLAITILLVAFAARGFVSEANAAESLDPSRPRAEDLPQGERNLIDIFADIRKKYVANHGSNRGQDARLEAQVRVLDLLRQNQEAVEWIGTVRAQGQTLEGNCWITVEVADDAAGEITVSTARSVIDDVGVTTLIRPGNKLFPLVQTLRNGQQVIFTGFFLKSVLAEDEAMIMHPDFVFLFTDIKLLSRL